MSLKGLSLDGLRLPEIPKIAGIAKIANETKGNGLPLINTDQEQALDLAVLERTP